MHTGEDQGEFEDQKAHSKSVISHSKYLLPPVVQKKVDDVDAVESVCVNGVSVMLQDAADG